LHILVASPDQLKRERLTPTQLEQLSTVGYLSFDNIASGDEIQAIRKICERLIIMKAGAREGAYFDFVGENPAAPTGLTQLLMPSNFDTRLRRLAYHKRLKVLAKQILGPRARMSGDHLFYKPPVAGPATPWHQDEAFHDPKYAYKEVTFWLPLQDATVDNGCLGFIPGSNLGDVQPHRKLVGKERSHGIECHAGFDPAEAVYCPVPAGGCTMHMGRTIHGAGANSTNIARYAYAVIFDIPATLSTEHRVFDWRGAVTARDETEREWRRGKGRLIAVYRKLMRPNSVDPYRIYYSLKRRSKALIKR
jgi:ectoine hydroxylase-related dioxygenase (phytanoyl-CoA dioxygenase family)